jgi:hypothetical protein
MLDFVVFVEAGRFGNALFRYLAASLFSIKYNMIYSFNKTLTAVHIDDSSFFEKLETHSEGENIVMSGFFQFDEIYIKHKTAILEYANKNKNIHHIGFNKSTILMNQVIDDIKLAPSQIYDIAIHVRLDDFIGRPDFIEPEYYIRLFDQVKNQFNGKKIAIVIDRLKYQVEVDFIQTLLNWFKTNNITVAIESNNMWVDFNILKQAKTIVCSMSTFSWMAAYFSKSVETCYMPNYNFGKERPTQTFKRPIENTIFYDVKTTSSI